MAAPAPDVQELQREVARLTALVGAHQNTTELLVAQHRKEEKKNKDSHHLRKPTEVPEAPFILPADVPNRRYANLFASDAVGQCGYPYALDLTEVYEPAYQAALAHPRPAPPPAALVEDERPPLQDARAHPALYFDGPLNA